MRITYQPTYGVSRHVDPISPEEAAAIVLGYYELKVED